MAIVYIDFKKTLEVASEPDRGEMTKMVLDAEKKMEELIQKSPFEYSWQVLYEGKLCKAEAESKIKFLRAEYSTMMEVYMFTESANVFGIGFRIYRETLIEGSIE